MSEINEESIQETFNSHFDTATPKDILRDCVQLCKSFNKTAEDIVFKWQSISMNTRGGGFQPPDANGIALLKRELQKGINQTVQAKKGPLPKKPQARPSGQLQARQAPVTSSASVLPGGLVKSEPPPITIHGSNEEKAYRYMHEKIAERSTVLDDQIDEFAELVRTHYNLEDIGDPALTSEEELVVVGRICCDEDAKLNEASIVLETSRLMGAGARVPLKFQPQVAINSDATVYGFFPGGIVALKGRNETGEWFQVSEIMTLPMLPNNSESVKQARPISMSIAAGPFTPDSDLDYVPFSNFLDENRNKPPSWILLVGPFIDLNHSKIRAGDVDQTPAELFRTKILSPLRQFLKEHPSTTALIVPSVRDLISHHAVFPQPPFPIPTSHLERIVYLSNPGMFTIDHVKFAVTSVDVLFHLQSQLLRKQVSPTNPAAPIDAMASLSSHVLIQRSFYPIFPAHHAASSDINLDVSHSETFKLEDSLPDVLILPSNLKQFHKVVHGTAVINPSFLSKGIHALLHIGDRRSRSDLENGELAGVRAQVQLNSFR